MAVEYVSCPYCAEDVKPNAMICKHCNAKLKRKCEKCEKLIGAEAVVCEYCGYKKKYHHLKEGDIYKSKGTAIALAILLGGLGAHKFYLGKNGIGVVYVLLCWTFLPLFISLLEAIVFLSFTEKQWINYVNDRPIRS